MRIGYAGSLRVGWNWRISGHDFDLAVAIEFGSQLVDLIWSKT